MTEWICRRNIDRFHRELAEATNDARRARLEELLDQEKTKLDQLADQQPQP